MSTSWDHDASVPPPPAAAPTWRDLPYEPPYGPVPPPRTANIGPPFQPTVVEQDATISPRQIALYVGGLLLLIAIGIGGTLWLLRDDEPDLVAQTDPRPIPSVPEQDSFDVPLPTEEAPPPAQGELEPVPDQQATPDLEDNPSEEAPGDEGRVPEPGSTPSEPDTADDPAPEATAPPADGQVPPPTGQLPEPPTTPPEDQPDLDLPRIFELRRLPAGTGEDATTVRQTVRDDETVTEQETVLMTDAEEEIIVTATRAVDAQARLDDLTNEGSTELTISGQAAFQTADGRLVYLVGGGGDTGTLIVIDGPDDAQLDALVTIAQGLELVQ